MAKKTVRIYFSTFVDVEMDSDEFASDEKLVDFVESNSSEYIDDVQIMKNLALQEGNSDVY